MSMKGSSPLGKEEDLKFASKSLKNVSDLSKNTEDMAVCVNWEANCKDL